MVVSRRKFIWRTVQALAALALVDAFWAEKFFVDTKEFFLGDASPASSNLKILQLSDLHLQHIGRPHREIAKQIERVKPDLICITGDAVDERENLDLLKTFLSMIDTRIPKVAILGNWEYWGHVDLSQLKSLYAEFNCDLLVNRSAQYLLQGKSVAITGIDDLLGGAANYLEAVKTYTPSDLHIVLTHCPEHRDHIAHQQTTETIDLILSGHTHGGQITMFGFAPLKPRGSGNYLKGWYNGFGPKLYVSKGVGTSIVPIRFGARAEISVFHFKA